MPPKFFYKKKTGISKTVSKGTAQEYVSNPNSKYLIIVESPSKCSKIEDYLGSDYMCIASKGHIRHIDGLKSIDINSTFTPTFSIIDEKQAHVDKMREIISRFPNQHILLATDDDREGEAIAWHLSEVFGLSIDTTPRIIFHEITKTAICNAVQSPGRINMNLVYAQHARQVLDIIVGFKISPFLWKYIYSNKANSLSAGRCQTPALRLIYDNDRNKKETESRYKTTGHFFEQNLEFILDHEFTDESEIRPFLELSADFSHRLSVSQPKETHQSAPKPFNTSRLLQASSNQLHMSPKETMGLCQQLYQDGHITYMRTDSIQYSKAFLLEAEKYIVDTFRSDQYLGDIDTLEQRDNQNPHEAIRVTHIDMGSVDNPRLNSLYHIIWRNSIESCMSTAKYHSIIGTMTAPMDMRYTHKIDIPLFLGWKQLCPKKEDDTSTGRHLYLLANERSNKPVKYHYIDCTVVVRNKHSHYCEASLIHKLEELGIGRPSTFASIVDTIQDRGYVKRTDIDGITVQCNEYKLRDKTIEMATQDKVFGKEKNKLLIQPSGILAVEFLIKHFDTLFSYEYTKTMESQLDKVSCLENSKAICAQCFDDIKKLSKPIAKLEKQAFVIDSSNEVIIGQYGPVIKCITETGEVQFRSIDKALKLDMEKVKQNGYTLDELVGDNKTPNLGEFNGVPIVLKSGKYGPYIDLGERKISIRTIKKPLDQVTYSDIEPLLLDPADQPKKKDPSILRILNSDMAVRQGKFGPYVYYKTREMKTPRFLDFKKFDQGYLKCDANEFIRWLRDTHAL